ncbi:SixA phosphatase family protein [Qipengyuania flava]|nr:phosphoglycerate mutase family protein [Qipengyuania flava]
MNIRLSILFFAMFALAACVTSNAPSATERIPLQGERSIFVTRHMQKAAGEDPVLNPEGLAAAEQLADLLASRDIKGIFATATRRAMETAAPLSARIGVPIATYNPRDPDSLAAAVSQVKGDVLIVGHSNTVPQLVASFGGHPLPEMTEQDYGTVFRIDANGSVRLIILD